MKKSIIFAMTVMGAFGFSALQGAELSIASLNVLHQKPLAKFSNYPGMKDIVAKEEGKDVVTQRGFTNTILSDDIRRDMFLHEIHSMIDNGQSPDVFCFQEITPKWLSDDQIKKHYHVFMFTTIALLVKKDVVSVGSLLAEAREIGGDKKLVGDANVALQEGVSVGKFDGVSYGAVWASFVDRRSGRPVVAISTHLPFLVPDKSFEDSRALLSTSVNALVTPLAQQDFAVLMAGDFNMETDPCTTLDISSCRFSSFAALTAAGMATARSVMNGSGIIIDHVIASVPVTLRGNSPDVQDLVPHAATDSGTWTRTWPSDHTMLRVVVGVNASKE